MGIFEISRLPQQTANLIVNNKEEIANFIWLNCKKKKCYISSTSTLKVDLTYKLLFSSIFHFHPLWNNNKSVFFFLNIEENKQIAINPTIDGLAITKVTGRRWRIHVTVVAALMVLSFLLGVLLDRYIIITNYAQWHGYIQYSKAFFLFEHTNPIFSFLHPISWETIPTVMCYYRNKRPCTGFRVGKMRFCCIVVWCRPLNYVLNFGSHEKI